VELSSENVREAIAEPVTAMIDAVKSTLDRTPPELAADIMDRGICLSGGGALLAGLTQRINHDTGMPCFVAPDPLYAVVIGSGRALENIEAMRGMMSSTGLDQQ
jgi:rod shape-determining protein MreB